MMDSTGRTHMALNRAILGSGAVSALLFGRMFLFDAPAFTKAFPEKGPQWAMPDTLFLGYDQAYLQNLRMAMNDLPDAIQTIRAMHLGTDMLLPLFLGVFLGLLLVRFMTGTFFFGCNLTRRHILILLLLPLGYVICDYAENISSLLFFQPSQPSPQLQDQLSAALPWFTRLKFMCLAVTALILLRQFLSRWLISKSGH
jgi:hypothetical protein